MNTKRTLFLTISALLAGFVSFSQKFEWSVRFGGAGADEVAHIASDADGNIWSAGWFSDTVHYQISGQDFMIVSSGGFDGLLMRHNSLGELQWVGTLSGAEEVRCWSVVPTEDGGAVACGTFRGTVQSGSGLSLPPTASNGQSDCFVLRTNAAGELVWFRAFGGDSFDNAFALTFNASGDIWIVGSFLNTVDFDPGPGEFLMTSAGSSDAFALRLNGEGEFVNAFRFGGVEGDLARNVTIDSEGDLIIVGDFSETVDFDPGAGTAELTSLAGLDCFVLKITQDEDFLWARAFGGNGDDRARSVAIHPDQSILVSGEFTNNLIFDSENPSLTLNSSGGTDAYIARLSNSGDVLWNQRFGGLGSDHGRAVAADEEGNFFWTGFFSQTAHLGLISEGVSLVSAGNSDAFVFKFNSDNQSVWKRRAGGGEQDNGFGLCIDPEGDIIAGGIFRNQGGWHPAWPNNQMSSAGSQDIYWWKMSDCGGTGEGEAYHFSCGQSLNINGQNFNQPGIYVQNLFTSQGCDTLVTLTIEFFVVDPTIVLVGDSLVALSGYDSYQWLLCDGNFTPIEGATATFFAPEGPGVYAVSISNGPCTEISECLTIVSVNEWGISGLLPFPNPNQGQFSLDLGSHQGPVYFSMYDSGGREVDTGVFPGGGIVGIDTALPSGFYMAVVRTGDVVHRFRVSISR